VRQFQHYGERHKQQQYIQRADSHEQVGVGFWCRHGGKYPMVVRLSVASLWVEIPCRFFHPGRILPMADAPIAASDPWFQFLFADRMGGANYGKGTEIYKFEKIKRAKRKA